ncbi:MAG: four helix bundle protein [Fluviicola sp.]|jgi:four helix bundle protein|nr:four helix bundle protein [Fluviicola sp.]
MAVHNFRRLEIWKNSMELTKSVYNILSEIPIDEKFGLKSQISRSSVSIPSNIAEGSGRNTNKDFANFLSYSLGSSYELETQLILVQELFNIDCEKIINDCQQVQKMIFGFKNNLIKN